MSMYRLLFQRCSVTVFSRLASLKVHAVEQQFNRSANIWVESIQFSGIGGLRSGRLGELRLYVPSRIPMYVRYISNAPPTRGRGCVRIRIRNRSASRVDALVAIVVCFVVVICIEFVILFRISIIIAFNCEI